MRSSCRRSVGGARPRRGTARLGDPGTSRFRRPAEINNLESSRSRLRDVLGAARMAINVACPFHELQPGCDLSAFTTGPEKNPTLTAMALSIRAADHLATELA